MASEPKVSKVDGAGDTPQKIQVLMDKIKAHLLECNRYPDGPPQTSVDLHNCVPGAPVTDVRQAIQNLIETGAIFTDKPVAVRDKLYVTYYAPPEPVKSA